MPLLCVSDIDATECFSYFHSSAGILRKDLEVEVMTLDLDLMMSAIFFC